MMKRSVLKGINGGLALAGLLCLVSSAHAQIGYSRSMFYSGFRSLPLVNIGTGAPPAVVMNGVPYPAYLTPSAYLGVNTPNGFRPSPYADLANRTGVLEDSAAGGAPVSESVNANFEKDGKLHVEWQGDPSVVNRLTFALLDKDRKVIKEQTITKLPAEARFTLTNRTAFYRIFVKYVNGSTGTMIAPL